MTYGTDVARAATALHALATEEDSVTTHNLEVAMLGQSAALDLAAALLEHTRSGYGAQARPRIAETARDPVETLAVLVHAHPRSLTRAPSDVLANAATSTDTGTRRWGDVARYALAARHHWDASLPAARPRGEAAWSLAADAAHIANAAAGHTAPIADRLRDVGRHVEADAFDRAESSGLPIAASEVLATASAGELAPVREPHPKAGVVLIRGTDDLVIAQQTLPRLLAQAPTMSPRGVKTVALGQARLAGIVAGHTRDSDLRGRLRALARSPQLPELAGTRAETIHRTDPLPEHQTVELLTAARRRLQTADADRIGHAILQTASDILGTLRAIARREDTHLRWYIPTLTHTQMLWKVGHTRIGDILDALTETANAVALPPARTAPEAPARTPRDILRRLHTSRQRAGDPREQGAPAYHRIPGHDEPRPTKPVLARTTVSETSAETQRLAPARPSPLRGPQRAAGMRGNGPGF